MSRSRKKWSGYLHTSFVLELDCTIKTGAKLQIIKTNLQQVGTLVEVLVRGTPQKMPIIFRPKSSPIHDSLM